MADAELPHLPAEIRFHMEGPALEKDIPLHLMLGTLNEFQSIVDKTYLGLLGRKRMSKDERLKFQMRTPGIHKGSLDGAFNIVMAGTQAFMPFYSMVGPSGIWDYTKETFDFLKSLFENYKNGKPPLYSVSGDNSKLVVDNSEKNTTFNGPVNFIGEQAFPHYQNLTRRIEDEGVASIEFGKRNSKILLTRREKELFNLPSIIDDKPMTLDCEVFDFNKFDNVGKLLVAPGQKVPAGEYRFTAIGDQESALYIEAMMYQKVKIRCLKEMTPDPFAGSKITALQVIEVRIKRSKA
jgi:hypothetical protein